MYFLLFSPRSFFLFLLSSPLILPSFLVSLLLFSLVSFPLCVLPSFRPFLSSTKNEKSLTGDTRYFLSSKAKLFRNLNDILCLLLLQYNFDFRTCKTGLPVFHDVVFVIKEVKSIEKENGYSSPLCSPSLPGLVSSDVALDDDGFLFEEPEVPSAEEASDVPLDGDGGPGLGTDPLLLQLLVQKLLEEHLTGTHTYLNMLTCTVKTSNQCQVPRMGS